MTISSEISKPDMVEAIRELRTLITSARPGSNTVGLANPVLKQLVLSMGGTRAEAAISDLEFVGSGLTGMVVLFSGQLLLVARITDAPTTRDEDAAMKAAWSASVMLFPRAALRRIDVEAQAQDAQARVILDPTHLASETTKVRLHYEGMEPQIDPIEVTSANTLDLVALLALVRRDLEST